MTDIATLTSVSVASGYFTDDIVSLARDCLAGSYDDYYFFQYNSTDFCLLVGDLSFNDSSVTADSCICYQFRRSPVSVDIPITIPFSGSDNGTYGGSDGAGGYNGNVTGNSSYTLHDTTYNFSMISYTAYSVSVSNDSDYLVYGSADYMPHLIQGVDYYAFSAFCLAFGIIAFKLFDRVFRRVY